jgi:hypothetical protein
MPSEQLVLLKSRTQNLFEMMVMPLAILPLGPAMRGILGDRYSPLHGTVAAILMLLLVCKLSGLWAAQRGGEWVTKPERLRRSIQQSDSISRWKTAGATTAMMALILVAVFLIMAPLDQFASALGGMPVLLGLIAAASALVGVQPLLRSVVTAERSAADQYRSNLRSALPRIYLAYCMGAVGSTTVALAFQGVERIGVFVVGALAIAKVSQWLLFRNRPPAKLYRAANDSFGRVVAAGLLLWGIPMGIMSSGMIVLLGSGVLRLRGLLLMVSAMFLSALGGLVLGALLYVFIRVTDSRPRRTR